MLKMVQVFLLTLFCVSGLHRRFARPQSDALLPRRVSAGVFFSTDIVPLLQIPINGKVSGRG